jgi:glyoxylase-like metal-dependent hydrolase (beta-lactamase superfamily II)
MEIAPNIHRIKCPFDTNRVSFVHLFVGSEAAMLVDTCCAHNPDQDILPYMRQIGLDLDKLRYLLISHSDLDHQGGNLPMKQAAPHALLVCHNLDRAWIENTDALITGRYMQFDQDHGFVTTEAAKEGIRAQTFSAPVNVTLEGGETFRLSPDWYVEAVHTPGHTWGHLAVYDPQSKTLAAGEAALWNAILDIDWQPALPPTYCYVDTYLATLERLMAMDIQNYSPAHWPLQQGSAVGDFLRESRNYCLHNEQKLLELARTHGPFTLREAIEILSPQIGQWPTANSGLLAYPLAGNNLSRLVQRGQLAVGRSADQLVQWSLPT